MTIKSKLNAIYEKSHRRNTEALKNVHDNHKLKEKHVNLAPNRKSEKTRNFDVVHAVSFGFRLLPLLLGTFFIF